MSSARDAMICPTCGSQMDLLLVGKTNPVYVARCQNITVPHPVWVFTPSFTLEVDESIDWECVRCGRKNRSKINSQDRLAECACGHVATV